MIPAQQLEAIQALLDRGYITDEVATNTIALYINGFGEEAYRYLKANTRAHAKLTFRQYIQKVDPTYQFYRHNELIIEQLQRVADDELKRLMVFCPPRIGKSYTSTVLFSSYYIYLHPERFVGIGSYSGDLAKEFTKMSRDFYKEAEYQQLPEVQPLSADLKGAKRWGTVAGGGVWGVGRGGSATGKGGHLLIMDDPLKDAKEAQSPAILKTLEEWWQSVFYTRQMPVGQGAVVICQTRWSNAEITSKILNDERIGKTNEKWTIVCLEAVKEAKPNNYWPKSATLIKDWRKPGESICPEMVSAETYKKIRQSVGEYYWSALYQQSPKAGDGTVFKAKCFQRYTRATIPASFDRIIASWDCTFEDAATSDYVVGTVLGQLGPNVYVLDLFRGKWDFVETINRFRIMLQKWPQIKAKVIEKKASGHALIQSLRRVIPGIVPFNPGSASKYSRAMAIQHYVEGGNIFIPDDSESVWVDEWLNELTDFPMGKNDDCVDSFVQGVTFLANTPQFNPAHNNVAWGRANPRLQGFEDTKLLYPAYPKPQ